MRAGQVAYSRRRCRGGRGTGRAGGLKALAAARARRSTALAATGAAVYTTAVSRHAPNPVGHAALMVVVCLTFVAAGVVALRRPPYARFGLLLSAVGFSALLGGLHDANAALPYTVGVLTANLVFALLVHALLAFPKGRLFSRDDRVIVVAAYANVLVLQAVAVLFDPLTRWDSDHPRNLALVDSHASLATVLEELEAAVAVAIALAVVARISRRARAATPVARRQLLPVLAVGKLSLIIFAAGLALAPLSSGAAVAGIGLGLLVSVALPVAFLAVILHGRLARAAVGELLVELRAGGEPPDLQDALRRALGDPSLELARRDREGRFVDGGGQRLALPAADGARVATPVLHQGEAVGALIHDRSLRLRPELLDAVGAAAGFALANERALEAAQRADAELRQLVDEQAALRRVATLVAADASPDDVFQAVTEEVSLLLGIPSGALDALRGRPHRDARRGLRRRGRPRGSSSATGWLSNRAWRRGRCCTRASVGRVDGYEGVPGEVAERMRATGFRRVVAVPVTVAGATWGALVAALRGEERLSSETELRLEQFAALVAMALASAQARDELAASRAPHRRGRRRRAPAARAEPPRRRAAAPRRALDGAAARATEAPRRAGGGRPAARGHVGAS